MPIATIASRGRISGLLGVAVAASLQKNLRANIDRIFKHLKERGVTQVMLADEMGVGKSLLTQLKTGDYEPSLEWLEGLLKAINKFDKDIGPIDLFRDPNGRDDALRDLVEELARRAGYEVKRKSH